MEPWQEEARRTAQLEAELSSRPVCDICGLHVLDEFYYNFDGQYVCPDCLYIWAKDSRVTIQ